MQSIRRSSKEWFRIWDGIISLEDTLSRLELSERSGASVQTIKSLQKDWLLGNEFYYENGQFRRLVHKNISLSPYIPATKTEKEGMK